METLEEPILAGFEEALWSCPQAYPASRLPLPGSDEAAKITVGSGRQCSMLFETSSPLGAFSKILLESLHWTNSEEYCYVWERLDTKFACSAFQLTALGQSTDDSGYSLWRTPNTLDALPPKSQEALDHEMEVRIRDKHPGRPEPANLKDQVAVRMDQRLWPTATSNPHGGNAEKRAGGINLATAARLWPTPTVPNGGRRNPEGTSITGKKPDGGKAQMDLREYAIRTLYATPQAHDATKGNSARVNRFGTDHGGRNLNDEMADSNSGSLNPRFVEELMGYEIDHTDLKRSAMPSCRSKPTRSSKQLHKQKVNLASQRGKNGAFNEARTLA